MIQMRWIVVTAGSGRGLLGGSNGQMHETVLQFRESRKYNCPEGSFEDFNGVEWNDVTPPDKWLYGGDSQP